MRALTLCALLGTTLLALGAAQARDRELNLRIKPRSWLDAGTQVEVGSMQGYMYDVGGLADNGRFGARGSRASSIGRLRPGEGITFETPSFWSVR